MCSLEKSSVIAKIKVCQSYLAEQNVSLIVNVLKWKNKQSMTGMRLQKWLQPNMLLLSLFLLFFWLSSFYSHGKWFECLMGHFIGKWTIVMKLPNTQCAYEIKFVFFLSYIKLTFWCLLKHILGHGRYMLVWIE